MNKSLLIGLIIAGLGLIYLLTKQATYPVINSQTQQEAAQEIEEADSEQEATDMTMEKIDDEFSADLEADFATSDLSDDALGL